MHNLIEFTFHDKTKYIALVEKSKLIDGLVYINPLYTWVYYRLSAGYKFDRYFESQNSTYESAQILFSSKSLDELYIFADKYFADNNIQADATYHNVQNLSKKYIRRNKLSEKFYEFDFDEISFDPINHDDPVLVYMMFFEDRYKNRETPYLYIGYSEGRYKNGQIVSNRNNKLYEGSGDIVYRECVAKKRPTVILLGTYETPELAIKSERNFHVHYDVVASPIFFNKNISNGVPLDRDNYVSLKHIYTGKSVRLPKDHPDVIAGLYKSNTCNMKRYTDGINFGMFNPKIDSIPEGWYPGSPSKNRLAITDGNNTKFIHASDSLPDGWQYGNHNTSGNYYTNGNVSILVKDDIIPIGFRKGHHNEGSTVYTNGDRDIKVHVGDEIPGGFFKGTIHDGSFFITNGITNTRGHFKDGIPEGYWVGITTTNNKLGKSWYKNLQGTESKFFLPEQVPDGWVLGRILPKRTIAWFNNGKEHKKFMDGEIPPNGWVSGMLKRS